MKTLSEILNGAVHAWKALVVKGRENKRRSRGLVPLTEQVQEKFGVVASYEKLVGNFDLSITSYKEINDLIISTNLERSKIGVLPFVKKWPDREIALYEINQDVYVTQYDEPYELWCNWQVIDIYFKEGDKVICKS